MKIEIDKYQFDESIIYELKRITLLPEFEIVSFVQESIISYTDLKYWYLAMSRMPNIEEQYVIFKLSVEFAISWFRLPLFLDLTKLTNIL